MRCGENNCSWSDSVRYDFIEHVDRSGTELLGDRERHLVHLRNADFLRYHYVLGMQHALLFSLGHLPNVCHHGDCQHDCLLDVWMLEFWSADFDLDLGFWKLRDASPRCHNCNWWLRNHGDLVLTIELRWMRFAASALVGQHREWPYQLEYLGLDCSLHSMLLSIHHDGPSLESPERQQRRHGLYVGLAKYTRL